MKGQRARLVMALGIIITCVASAGIGVQMAPGQAPSSFTLTSSANTAIFELDVQSAPLLGPQLFSGGPSAAEAELDSFGGSTAYAGAPFLGQTIEGAGGLVNGLGFGVLPPLPSTLPGYVSTSNPSNQTQNNSQGPYSLSAKSTQNESTATAGISDEPNFLSSNATATDVLNTDGSIESTAQSITQPFAIGNLLQIGTVQASATMSLDDSGKEIQTSSFDLGTITIAGVNVGLTQNGLTLGSTTLAVPSLGVLSALLAADGITLALLPGSKTATSITSEGLQIGYKTSIPVEGATGVVLTIGQATASMSFQASQPETPLPVIPNGLNQTSSPSISTGPSSSGVPSIATNPSVIPSTAAPVTSSAPTQIPTRTAPLNAADLTANLGPDGVNLYLILLLAGLLLLGISRAAGILAVRRPDEAEGTVP